MNLSRHIAKRLLPRSGKRYARPIIRISVISVALGVCVMIWAFAITSGFRKEIREKVVGFAGHIEIHYFDNNISYEKQSIRTDSVNLEEIARLKEVADLQPDIHKAGIIQKEDVIEGVVFKGVSASFPFPFFQKHLVRGRLPVYEDSITSNDILLSESMARKLRLDTGDKIRVFFVQQPVRQRSFRICGLYNTGLSSYDNNLAVCDIKHLQKLNGWEANEVDGIEVMLHDFRQMESAKEKINALLPYDWIAETAKERHRNLFDWMDLFDQNILVLVILITIVVCITLISTQLTLVLEQTSNIGILQTLGASNNLIRNVFLTISGKILLQGLLWGNGIALAVCFLQNKTHLIRLNPENYFVDYVPMLCQWQHLLGINLFVWLVTMLVLILPTHYITTRIRTVEAIRSK